MLFQRISCFYSVVLLALAGGPFTALATLDVVADHGSRPAAAFYDAINNSPDDHAAAEPGMAPLSVPGRVSDAMTLPVQTPELTPGRTEDRSLNLPGIGALYLVGDDPLSRAWLTENAAGLKALNAVGMVVNVQHEQALRELQALTQNGALSPAPGSELARRLGLSHYPVLITATRLTQQVTP